MKSLINSLFLLPFIPNISYKKLIGSRYTDTLSISILCLLLIFQVIGGYFVLPVSYEELGLIYEDIPSGQIGINHIMTVVYYLITLVVCAYYLFHLGNIISSTSKVSLSKIFNIVILGSIVDVYVYLIRIPLIVILNTTKINFGPSFFIEADGTFFSELIKFVDLLLIWKYVIIGIGLSSVYKYKSWIYIVLSLSFLLIYGIVISLLRTSFE